MVCVDEGSWAGILTAGMSGDRYYIWLVVRSCLLRDEAVKAEPFQLARGYGTIGLLIV